MNTEELKNLSLGNIHNVFVEGLGLIMGTLQIIEEVIVVEKPLAIQSMVSGEQVQMRFAHLIGNPERIYLIRSPVFITEPTDLKFVNTYKEAVSPIKIAPASALKVLKGGNGGIANDIG